jgi:hypothetical protein
MKASVSLACGLAAALFFAQPARVWAQGPLTPPGAPGLTMKTLAQVEPRTPIGSAPVTLSRPGSYYLTTNLSDTVTITADNVTLDLMGFTITGPAAGGNAITLSGTGVGKNLLVHNGVVVLPTIDGVGISTIGAGNGVNGRIESLRVSGGRYGIYAGSGCTVRDCQVTGSVTGIRVAGSSIVRECRLEGNITGLWLAGTGAFVEDNIIRGNTNNFNFAAGNRLKLLLYEVPETLSWPCSVKFAGTLSMSKTFTHGITVNADDVTIDLAGHALIGPGASSWSGICQSAGYRNLRIMNGAVNYWVGQYGINLMGTAGAVSDVHAATNNYGFCADTDATFTHCVAHGNKERGFYANERCIFSDCVASYNKGEGLMALEGMVITDCLATGNGSAGIATFGTATVTGCTAKRNYIGILGDGDCITMRGCSASDNTRYGIGNQTGGVISECVAQGNGEWGIISGRSTLISGCSSYDNGAEGFYFGLFCRVLDCMSWGNGSYGIYTWEPGSSIVGCTVYDNLNTGIFVGGEATVSECSSANNTACGITVGPGSSVSGCRVLRNGDNGIEAGEGSTVSACTVARNAQKGVVTGRDSTVSDCTVTSNGVGIVVGEACKISACAAQRNGGVGIFAELGGAIADCTAEYNKSNGVHIAGNTMVTRCVSNNNGENGTGAGFFATGSGNRIEGNHAFKNDRGFVTVEGANFIFRNTARWNSPNWSLASGNLCLVVTGTAAGAISGDSGGTSPGSADPNANFTY